MNAAEIAIDKRRGIEELWEKLRDKKTDPPEYKTIAHEI
jgi:hypothetical protein